jgi:hypothetical protein
VAKHYNTGEALDDYKKIEKDVAKKIRLAKKKFEKDMAFNEDRNHKKFSNYVKSKTKARAPIGPLLNKCGTITADKQEMADTLNTFFASVFTTEDKSNMPVKERETNVDIRSIEFTFEKVLRKLKELRSDSAPGPDKIHPRLLKEMRYELAEPLSVIFTKSLQSCSVPVDWKTAIVIPIFKKGAKAEPGNYRPVSLTSVACKLWRE